MKFKVGDRVKITEKFYSKFYGQSGTIVNIKDGDFQIRFDKFPKIGFYWLEYELCKLTKLEEAMK